MEKNNIAQFISQYSKFQLRYLAVVVVFLAAFSYSKMIADVAKVEENKGITYESSWKVSGSSFNINRDNPKKVYRRIIDSNNGDSYRLLIKGSSDKEEKVKVFATSEVGEKYEISELKFFSKEDKLFELVFFADGNYQNISLEKEAAYDYNEFEPDNVYINYFHVSRLNINNKSDLDGLESTVFGNTKLGQAQPIEPSNKDIKNMLLSKDSLAGQMFVGNGDFLAAVEVNLSKIGNGGLGQYKLELYAYDKKTNKTNSKVIKKIAFSSADLPGLIQKNGNFRMDFPVATKKDSVYFIGINNDSAITDKDNYLKINYISGGENNNFSFFSLVPINLSTTEDGSVIITNSVAEDLGDSLHFSYNISHTIYDFFDIYDYQGDIRFDKSEKTVLGEKKKGNFFIYEVNTTFPFEKMHVAAKGIDNEMDEMRMEYSYSKLFWKEIPFLENKDGSQEIDFVFSDNTEKLKKVYIKISYSGENNKNLKFFGLNLLEINASLKK